MHINSHYAATLENQPDFEALQDSVITQTCVIGAGYAGLTCARELARKGHDVVVLEAELVGWGASGRNGGFVSAGFARSLQEIEKVVGIEDTSRLYQLSVEGRNYVHEAIKELEIEEIIYGAGWLKLLRHNNTAELTRTRDMMARRFGVNLDFIEKDALEKYVRSKKYFAALYDDQPFHIQPLQYVCALARDISQCGGRLYEKSRVEEISKTSPSQDGRWRIECGYGSVIAENIVLATSAYGGPHGKLNRAMIPIATYVVSSAPCGDLLDKTIPFTGCIADTRRSGDYYRTIGKGSGRRLIWGGRITTLKTQPKRLGALLKQDISSAYPELKSIEIERAWSGLMGYATHKMPIIGKLEEGLWAATAFGGHGLNTCAMAGQLISNAIVDSDDQYRLFDRFGTGSSGGIFGRLATQLEYWRLQYLDRRDENVRAAR